MEGRGSKPEPWENACRSRTWSPIAMAGRCFSLELREVMMPKGMLEREKWLSAGMESQDDMVERFLGELRENEKCLVRIEGLVRLADKILSIGRREER